MLKTIITAAATLLVVSNASAMPIYRMAHQSDLKQSAKIVCQENGFCYRPNARKPAVRWVYGENVFYGPYVGPQYYGRPGNHHGWSFFGLFW